MSRKGLKVYSARCWGLASLVAGLLDAKGIAVHATAGCDSPGAGEDLAAVGKGHVGDHGNWRSRCWSHKDGTAEQGWRAREKPQVRC